MTKFADLVEEMLDTSDDVPEFLNSSPSISPQMRPKDLIPEIEERKV